MPITYGTEQPLIPEGADPTDYKAPYSFQRLRVKHNEGDRRRMESWTVYFDNSWGLTDMFVETNDGWLDYHIAPLVTEWLAENTTDYVVGSIDRGDFGEGAPIGDIDFAVKSEADAFIERFDVTINVLPYSRKGAARYLKRKSNGDD